MIERKKRCIFQSITSLVTRYVDTTWAAEEKKERVNPNKKRVVEVVQGKYRGGYLFMIPRFICGGCTYYTVDVLMRVVQSWREVLWRYSGRGALLRELKGT